MLIPTIKFYLAQDRDTSGLEAELRARLSDYLDSPDLLTLPQPFLSRVIVFSEEDDCDFDRLFEFCLRVLARVGPSASVLFRGLDLSRCSSPQLEGLRSARSFIWGFVGDSICSTLVDLQTTSLKLARLAEDQHADFERLQAQHRELMDADARQHSVHAGFQTDHRNLMEAYTRQQAVNEILQAQNRDMMEKCDRQQTIIEGLQGQYREVMDAHARQQAANERLQAEHRDLMSRCERQQAANESLHAVHRDLIDRSQHQQAAHASLQAGHRDLMSAERRQQLVNENCKQNIAT
jgi:hypothetical protein